MKRRRPYRLVPERDGRRFGQPASTREFTSSRRGVKRFDERARDFSAMMGALSEQLRERSFDAPKVLESGAHLRQMPRRELRRGTALHPGVEAQEAMA